MKLILATGIGRSEKAMQPKRLADRLDRPYMIFDWQQYIEPESDALAKKHTSYGSKGAKAARTAIYDYLYDETGYCKNRTKIHKSLSEMISSVNSNEVVLIGHSWASVIFYDYLLETKDSRVVKLITTGAPVPFKHGLDIEPIFCPWENYWEKNDALAHQMFTEGCKDIEFRSPNFWKGWNLLSHMSYFKSKKLSKMIKDRL